MVHRKLEEIKARGDHPFIWVPADTESVTLHSDWQQWGGGDFESLLTHISYEACQGVEFLDFPLAESGSSGTGLPCRFIIGDLDTQIHIRLPILYLSHTKIWLRLDTRFPQGLAVIFASFPPTIGVGITNDYVQWAQVLFAILADRSFEHVPKPIELDHLARFARINTTLGSMFALYWWVFGIILPKVYASRGDNQWGRPLKDMDVVFQIYANGEISCV